jgi:hypothetical protein
MENHNQKSYDKEETLLELVKRRYDAEWQRIKDLDNKAGNLIGFSSIITGLTVGVGTFGLCGKLLEPAELFFYFLGVSSLLASVFITLIATRVSEWETAPLTDWIENVLINTGFDYEFVLSQNIIRMGRVVKKLETRCNSKAKIIQLSSIALCIGLVSLSIYVAIIGGTGKLNSISPACK